LLGKPKRCARISFFAESFNLIPNRFARSARLSSSLPFVGAADVSDSEVVVVEVVVAASVVAAAVVVGGVVVEGVEGVVVAAGFLSNTMGVNLKLEFGLVVGSLGVSSSLSSCVFLGCSLTSSFLSVNSVSGISLIKK
jgi:hypothetical protein